MAACISKLWYFIYLMPFQNRTALSPLPLLYQPTPKAISIPIRCDMYRFQAATQQRRDSFKVSLDACAAAARPLLVFNTRTHTLAHTLAAHLHMAIKNNELLLLLSLLLLLLLLFLCF